MALIQFGTDAGIDRCLAQPDFCYARHKRHADARSVWQRVAPNNRNLMGGRRTRLGHYQAYHAMVQGPNTISMRDEV